jgi:hypothetical protein
VVDRELQIPLNETDEGYFSTILERSDSFQGRISNNQQIQIAIDFPQHREWVAQYRQWWQQGISGWHARQPTMPHSIFWWSWDHPLMRLPVLTSASCQIDGKKGLQIREWVKRSGQTSTRTRRPNPAQR